MAVAAPKAEKANVFAWEGSDRRGKRIKGETRAAVWAGRADLRRQGINPIKVTKNPRFFKSRKKNPAWRYRCFQPAAGHHDEFWRTLVQAFDIVGRGHDNPSMQDLILSIKADVEGEPHWQRRSKASALF